MTIPIEKRSQWRCFGTAKNRKFGVLYLIYALAGNLCYPLLERLGFWRRYRLDKTEKLLLVSHIRQPHLTVGCA